MFEFKGEDLTEEEDGGIIRRIQTRGEGYARPNDGAIVEGKAVRFGVHILILRSCVALGKFIPFPSLFFFLFNLQSEGLNYIL